MEAFHKVAILRLEDAKQTVDKLKAINVEAKLEHNDETCTRGCAVTVELHIAQSGIPKWLEFQHELTIQSVESVDYDSSLLDSVFDPSQEQASCPACGFQFSTSLSECPDCGLCI